MLRFGLHGLTSMRLVRSNITQRDFICEYTIVEISLFQNGNFRN